MNRRHFSRLAGSALLASAAPLPLRGSAMPAPRLRVDGARLNGRLAELARFGANEAGGIDRVAFSDADVEARAWVADLMRGAGLDVSVDIAGNLWGVRPGTDPSLKPLVLGSHIDSVPGGGNYDGQVGSMAALEVAWTLADADAATRHPLHFVVFPNEEGGKTGSRALAGEVDPKELDLVDGFGLHHRRGTAPHRRRSGPARRGRAGLRTPSRPSWSCTSSRAPSSDRLGIDIGVVEGIVGIMRWNVVRGGHDQPRRHHAHGPAPRRHGGRRPLRGHGLHRRSRSWPGTQVATVGRLVAEPGAPNVIPGRVTASLEVRDLSMDKIERGVPRSSKAGPRRSGADTGTTFAFERFYVSEAAPTAPALRDLVEATAQRSGPQLAAHALGCRPRRAEHGAPGAGGDDLRAVA